MRFGHPVNSPGGCQERFGTVPNGSWLPFPLDVSRKALPVGSPMRPMPTHFPPGPERAEAVQEDAGRDLRVAA